MTAIVDAIGDVPRHRSNRIPTVRMPLISLVLAVKNGLPQLHKAIEALRRQTHRNFEVVVQDGGSTDGTLEYLRSIQDLPKIDIVSQPDNGVGQAYNRGVARSHGEIVLPIACDEYLDDDALQKGASWFATYPGAAVVYGAARLADADDRTVQVFFPPPFDLTGVLRNEIVVPACAAFLSREKIGRDLYYDEDAKACPDYEFWIRIGSRFGPDEIIRIPEPIVVARCDRVSATYRAESYNGYCAEKLSLLNRFLHARGGGPETDELRRTASAGILTWAAESVFQIEGASPAFFKWCAQAAGFDPQSARLSRLAKKTGAFEIDPSSGRFATKRHAQPEAPDRETETVDGILSLDEIHSFSHWEGAAVEREGTLCVRTGEAPWAYAAQIPLNPAACADVDRWYWVKLDVRVQRGQVSVALFADDSISNERLISTFDGRVAVFVRISHGSANAVMIRNGSIPGRSVLEVLGASVETSPKTTFASIPD